jgi:hypothetical protein
MHAAIANYPAVFQYVVVVLSLAPGVMQQLAEALFVYRS